jgi:two-component system LytT family sensor kinase
MQAGLRTRLLAVVIAPAVLAVILLLVVNSAWSRWLSAGLLVVEVAAAVALLSRRDAEEEPPSQQLLDSISRFDTTLLIGDETLPYLKQGLNEESAQKICEIIHKITEVDAVAITGEEKILGFHGIGCRRHQQGGPILTGATRYVLDTGETNIINDPTVLTCDDEGCPHPLKSAVIAPLKYRGKVVGTFKLYRASPQPLPSYTVRLAVGISALLGLQMELAEAEHHRQLVTKARLEALQAQIRPHFLFNVLNTIIMFSRTDAERSRELLITLSHFFRRSLSYRGNFITLEDELEYISTYLSLEKARFGEKLQVKLRVEPELIGLKVPILTLQPLVENSVVHGLAPKEEGGVVGIRAHRVRDEVHVCIIDNGIGMDKERLRRVFQEGYATNMGLGLTSVNDRLVSLYGDEYRLQVRTRPGRGTAIRVRIPLNKAVG